MLMGEKKPLWERRWFLPSLMAAVLALGVGLGLGVGHWSERSVKPPVAVVVEQPPAPVQMGQSRPDETTGGEGDEEADRQTPSTLIQPPPQRPGANGQDAEWTGPASPQQEAALPVPQQPEAKMPPGATQPAWLRNAVAAPKTGGRPKIAIIIDDLGLDRKRSDRVATLRSPLTLAFMTYAEDLPHQAAVAHAHGHELMVHVPMQPLGANYDPGPDVLEVTLKPDEIRRRLDWGLSRFDGFIGINNHMGSRFTADRDGMKVVMDELKRRGMAFVDSVTTDKTVGADLARQYGVPFASRQIFLDNEHNAAAVRAQLAKVEAYASKHGSAIAIGHPYDHTIEALSGWLPGLEARGFVLVPVSAIIRQGPAG
jgi:polysaccharide deacetylase 2 family uncharacterized protein YibQ